MLLGGKVVACLIRSREVFDDFKRFYGNTVGIISGKRKRAELLAVTTTSSMGRSSVYNRLRLDGEQYLTPIGYTIGWGHFHIPEHLFEQIRQYLRAKRDPYAGNHQFGDGPNWRLRTIRKALVDLNINESVLRHGVRRDVFLSTFLGQEKENLILRICALYTRFQTLLATDGWSLARCVALNSAIGSASKSCHSLPAAKSQQQN
jgi:hypothetical protein